MKRIFTNLFVAVLLMLSSTSWAQLSSFEVGEVYHFKNIGANLVLTTNDAAKLKVSSTIDKTDIKQLWLVMQGNAGYLFRNLHNGKFLKGAGENAEWTLTTDCNETANQFTIGVTNTTYNYIKTNGIAEKGCAHYSAWWANNTSRDIIGWSPDEVNSAWEITKIDYEAADIETLIEKLPVTETLLSEYKTALKAIFADDACTELNSTYTAMSIEDIKNDANYLKLSSVLKKTVIKVRGGNDSWAEDNADADKKAKGLNWDAKYAKKFRVQMYEPYSIAGDITGFLRMNAHSNNDNPTGIYVNAPGNIYVMVEGEIKEGATLRLHCAGSNSRIKNPTGEGYELKSGLNVINIASVANGGDHLYVCYNVDTYNPNGATVDEKFPHKLSEYPPLKIHIEGGAINGFYNACGDFLAGKTYDGIAYNKDLWKEFTDASVDCDEDWEYMETRANLGVLPILGHRQILLFQLHDENGQKGMEYYLPEKINVPEKPYCYPKTTEWNDYGMGCNSETGKINIFMESWDRIMYSELATLGLVSKDDMDKMNERYPRWNADGTMGEIYDLKNAGPDGKTYQEFCRGLDYSEYFNHHGVSLGGTSGYMSAGWNEANYNNSTFGELMNLPNNSGNIWGPCHEIGHQFQDVFNIRGGTEVTNNVFSNAAIWYQGIATSRYNGGGLSTTLANFNSGLPFIDYNIWSMTQMFYKLWLYYHLAANNTQFYPRFFEMLRIDPLSAKGSLATGTESMLKIYEKMCDASGEDLTEFFRAHGFFVLLDSYPKEDYGITVFVQTQDEVDAAIARVKAKGYKPNYAALLINDMEVTATVRHDGETPRNHYDGPSAEKSEFGSVNDFITGNVATSAYTATFNSDGSITMSGGEGGVGFLVLDKNGKLLSFADKSTFALSEEAKLAIITGKASVVSINSDNSTPVEAVIDLTAMKQTLLADLIADVEAVIANVDDTFTKVGYYKPAAVADLKTLLDVVKDVYANGTAYGGAYEMLYNEYRNVIDNPNSLVGVISGKKYAIKNRGGNDYMTVSGSNVVTTGNSTLPTTDDNLWIIETSGENYHIKHAGTGMYLQGVSNENDVRYTVGNTAVNYMMTRIENAYYALSTVEHFARYMNRHGSDNVATWNTTDANSQWTITLVEEVQGMDDIANLELLVSKTRNLLDKVADVDYTGDAYPLQADDSSADFHITSNATEGGHEPKYLLDGATATFFHTVWAGSSPGAAHYLQIDLGEENKIDQFVFSYSTIGQTNVDAPEVIEITGSDSPNSGFQTIATLSGSLPTTHLTPYTSDVLGAVGTKYRYLRFTVTDATGGTLGGYYYFGISELAIRRINYKFNKLHSDYASVDENVVIAAIEQYEAAKQVMANGGDIAAAKTALQSAYDALVEEYSGVANVKKEELQKLINETKTLLNTVGSITTAETGELALQVSSPSSAYYLSTNSQESGEKRNISKLIDGITNNSDVYFHTDWQNSVNADHHLLLDMGDGNSLGEFTFKYTTRNNNAGIDAPSTIVVEGSNDNSGFTQIVELTGLPTGQHQTYESVVLGDNATKYRYVRFRVTSSSATKTVGGYAFFAMSEFDVTAIGSTDVTINEEYKAKVAEDLFIATNSKVLDSEVLMDNTISIELLDAQIATLQAAKAALEEAMAKVTIDKSELQALYDNALVLYGEMADADGNVNANYAPSALTNDILVAVKTALDAAKAQLDAATTQDDIDAAKNDLQALYNELRAVEDANVAETKDKEGLNNLINDATDLCNIINGNIEKNENYYAGVDGLAFDELSEALQAAQDAVSRYYLTEEQYTSVYNTLYSCYSATNAVVALDVAKDELNNLIATMQTKLEEVTVSGAVAAGSLPLQVDNSSKSYYICTYPRATDDNGLDALIDEIDGVANTGTFAGTYWQPDSKITDAYSHYVEIDLGVNTVLEDFAIDYTTRYSGAPESRPTGLKFYGSNDKEDYTELFSVTEGLPADANTKWEMSEPYKLEKNYRYIRVAVTSSQERHCFNMSDFNLYSHCTATVNEFYSTSDIFDCLPAALREYCDAKEAVSAYLLSADYEMAKNELQAQIDALQGVIDANVTDCTDLETLSSETDGLVTDVVVVKDEERVITMQCTDENAPYYLYCNADGTETNGDGDTAGVAALVGDNATNSTHLHTTYNNKAQDDDLDHYLRLDMGENEAMVSFKFRYTGRINNVYNAPTKMLIEGSNDLENFDEIATLDIDVPESGTATYSTENALGNGKAYRYIRFMVKDTKNHVSNNGHPFFVLSQFAVTACKTIEVNENYALNLQLKTLATAYNEVYDANIMVADKTHYVTREAYETALDELQKAKNALSAAMLLKDLPVKLTTDANNPVLYKIKIKSNENVFTYDGQSGDASKNPVLDVDALGNKYQAWYFMQGNNEDSNDDILILPYYHEGAKNTTLRLGYANTNEGTDPTVVAAKTNGTDNWYLIPSNADGYWNLQPQGGESVNAYVNQYGGSNSTRLAFWRSASNTGDPGSQFCFVLDETDYSLSDAYYALYKAWAAADTDVAYGTKIGTYTQESVTAYNTAYNSAAALLEAKNSTDDEYNSARTALAEAYDAIEYNGGLCRIRSAFTGGYSENKLVYVDAENNPYFEAATDEQLSKYVWEFVPVQGGYHLKSLHTQSYVTAAGWGGQVVLGDEVDAKLVTVDFLDTEKGIVRLNVAGGYPLHAQASGSKLVGYTGELGSASAWYVEEIEEVTTIKYTVTMKAKYSSVTLGYNATVPAGVEAFDAVGVDGDYITLESVGNVIPANTPVVLCRTDDESGTKTFDFKYTSDEATYKPEGSLLGGSLYVKYVLCDPGSKYYKLLIKNGVANMYWMYKEFDENGNKYEGTDDGGYIKCSANKIYMAVAIANSAVSYGLRFVTDGATVIEGVNAENGGENVVFDLQGRRVAEITSPGFYIVNGKKVYVK